MPQLNLTNEQYQELVLSTMIGNFIRETVAEGKEKEVNKLQELETQILSKAKDFDASDLSEDFKEKTIPSEKLWVKTEKIMDEYNDNEFWIALSTVLGKRDFIKDSTKEELEKIKKNDGILPEKITEYYDKYEKEFEKNGLENMFIKNNIASS